MSKSVKRCENCDAPKGKPCPRWVDESWGFFEKDIASGEQRLITGCFYHVSLRMMYEYARSMNSAASAVESTRNVMATGFAGVARAMNVEIEHSPLKLLK